MAKMINWRTAIAIMFAIGIFLGTYAYAGEWDTKSDIRVKTGMRVIKSGDTNYLVPEGGVVYREPGRVYMESSDEYAAREFQDTGNVIKAMERDLEDLKKRVKTIEDMLIEMADRQEPDKKEE